MNFYSFFENFLKTLRSFVREFNAHPTVKTFNSAVCKFQAYHQKGYAFLVQLPSYVAYVSIPILVLFYVVIIVPTVLWLLYGLTYGQFFMGHNFSIWEISWIVWQSCNDFLIVCGNYAACESCHNSSYNVTFFYLLGSDLHELQFHVLLACFLSFTTMYQASLFINLLNRKPTFKMVSYVSFFFGLLAYMLVLWILGLGSNLGPGNPVGFPLLCIFGLFIMHALWWLIQAFRCVRLAVGVLVVLLLISLIYYSLAYLWPFINAFEFYGLWRSWVNRTIKPFFSTMVPWSKKKLDEPQPTSPCRGGLKKDIDPVRQDFKDGKITADKAVEDMEKAHAKFDYCNSVKKDYKAMAAKTKSDQRQQEVDEAKHKGKLEQLENPTHVGKIFENLSEVLANLTGGNRGQDKGQDKSTPKGDEKKTK